MENNEIDQGINQMIDKTLNEIKTGDNSYDIGRVVGVESFILRVIGLDDVMYYERVIVGEKTIGYVIGIEMNYVNYVIMIQLIK